MNESRSARLSRLDVSRGIAAAIVILVHYQRLFHPVGSTVVRYEGLPWQDFLLPLYKYGFIAVPFFWILSGIVFQHTYGNSSPTFRSFFWRRVARLFPLNFVTLIVMSALTLIYRDLFGRLIDQGHTITNFILNVFMASNWITVDTRAFNDPVWSVSIEILAYVTFFLYLKFSSRSLFSTLMIASTFTALALSFANYQATCISLFFIGCLLIRVAPVMPFWSAFCALLVTALATGAVAISPIARHTELAAEYGLLPALLLIIAKFDLTRPPVRMTWMGDISYGVYMIHVPLLTIAGMLFESGVPNPAHQPWFLVAFIALVLSVAYASYRWLERPAQRLILRWQFHRDQPRPSPDW